MLKIFRLSEHARVSKMQVNCYESVSIILKVILWEFQVTQNKIDNMKSNKNVFIIFLKFIFICFYVTIVVQHFLNKCYALILHEL